MSVLSPGCRQARPALRERGFDQAALLAREVGARLGLPCRRLLRRDGGPPQTGRSLTERQVGPLLSALVPIRASDVLLVDDVVTTGSTMSAAVARCAVPAPRGCSESRPRPLHVHSASPRQRGAARGHHREQPSRRRIHRAAAGGHREDRSSRPVPRRDGARGRALQRGAQPPHLRSRGVRGDPRGPRPPRPSQGRGSRSNSPRSISPSRSSSISCHG